MTDAELLDFVRAQPGGAASDVAIRSRFGSPARFYQRLSRLLEDEAALRHDPELVYRLRRNRDERARARVRRRLR
ncbi:DUF3263 domain-containing protein [Rathayibacter sp. AY2B5]|uniref:DUF3263 domain-containing protein n=1 Tax=Rathayibacter sp. AY2B5 TaxID=2080570 RepID=UPI000CE7D78A|nr:DUF3263 domain-containing protein [Rathayibacter sp. AY2B5]PPG40179.1 DUF3263 domain-containing protein [Rathayibacter sp. AY2B5]